MKTEHDDILHLLLEDLNNARDAHETLNGSIAQWREEIYFNDKSEATKDTNYKYNSTIKLKDIERTIEQSVPNLVEPFVGSDEIISVKGDGSNEMSYLVQTLLNEQWNDDIDTIDLMNDVARVLQVDGSVILKTGWSDNAPTIELIPFEEIMFDPAARSVNDIKFAIQKRRLQIIDILDNPTWFGSYTADELIGLTLSNTTDDETYTENDGFGYDSDFNHSDKLRQYVDVYEYYGKMNINDEVKNIVAVFTNSNVLNVIDSPYPERWNGIPFDIAQYTKRTHSIFGSSIADLTSDYQSVRTGFMRAILENAQNANHNQKWNKKGALDVVNKRKMLQGDDFETNVDPQIAIVQGQFNQVPNSVFNIMDMMKQEQEEITGIARLSNGLDPRALNSNVSATAVATVNSNSEKRLLLITRNISSMMKRVFEKMLDLNMMLLEDKVVNLMGQDVIVNASLIAGSYKLKINVNTSGSKDAENQNILMMVQLLQSNAAVIPNAGSLVTKLLSRLSMNLNMTSIAQELRNAGSNNQQMQMMQQQIQDLQLQIETQKAQSEIAKNNAKASLDSAKAIESQVDAQMKAYGL